jgi:hypothetical protein
MNHELRQIKTKIKQRDKIRITTRSDYSGSYNVSIEYPDGKQDRKIIGYSLFGKAISMNKVLDSQHSDGAFDYHLTPNQYSKFLKRLVEFN